MSGLWRVVTSNKPRRKGEAFVVNGNRFVLKVYKDGVDDPVEFAHYLARQFNQLEERRAKP